MLLLLHCPIPRQTRQVGRDKPEGRRARCATFPDGTGTYLPEIPDQLSNPTRPHALGAAQGSAVPMQMHEGFQSGTLSMRCLQFGA